MQFIYSVFGYPLGWIMWAIYKVVPIYGIALILFTLLTKLILVPVMIKQQKSMAAQTAMRPRLEELQSKYKNNKEKLNQEMMKLYEEEGFNPMSGCLPMLIQFPILFGLFDVINNPLTHIMRFSSDTIAKATEILGTMVTQGNSFYNQIAIVKAVKANPAPFSSLGVDFIEKIENFNFNFLGIDLSAVPTVAFNLLLLVPILSFATSILLSLITMRQNKMTMGENAAGAGMTKGMMLMMPLMSLFISFSVPAGVGMYWILTNVFSCVQTMILNKYYNPKDMAEKAAAEAEVRREAARQLKIETKKQQREQARQDAPDMDEPLTQEALSQKEKNRRKLAEARRRSAERYGEEYVEVTEEDLK